MKNWKKAMFIWSYVLVISCIMYFTQAGNGVEVPTIFGSHMVMQREMELPIWGWGEVGEKVSVTMAGVTKSATADADGKWMVRMPAQTDKGPYKITIAGKNTIELEDVLIGEVWLCSGQSNMEMGIEMVKDGKDEVVDADYPEMRLFHVKDHRSSGAPEKDFPGCDWRYCISRNIRKNGWGGFSATGYYFGRSIHKKLDVPVGLIDSSWGGTMIEPWTPMVGFEQVKGLKDLAEKIRKGPEEKRKEMELALAKYADWLPKAQAAAKEGSEMPWPPAWPAHPMAGSGDPIALYNGMIHPLVPFAIRGAIWYQGESNCIKKDRMLYLEKMKALIGGWRTVWGQGEFPFYYVQLAPFDYSKHFKGKTDELPRIWEAQTAALSIPNTGMAVTVDLVDNLQDIHPANKKDVGERLALWALAKTYGMKDIVYSGPLYKKMKTEGDQIRVSFDYVEGLTRRDQKELSWFEIAGADKIFVKAEAAIDAQTNTVVVRSLSVKEPVAVRFAWDELAQPNLMNGAGLPASPFRTDTW